jgi:DNA-binding SARP family transcriptional activator
MIEVTGDRESRVRIRLAGSFAVEKDGSRRTIGGKSRTLLKLLAVERGHAVPTDRVMEVLWGDAPPKRPVENVATLVSRLRKALGPEVVVGGRQAYRLGDAPAVGVDLDEAAALVAEAEERLAADEAAVAVVAAARVVELLDGGAVPEEEWAAPARGEATALLRRARHAAAAGALRVGEPGRARRAAEAAVYADPFDEAAHRLLMRAHVAAGEPARALMAFERLRDLLATELGTDPAAETRAVHLAILREQPPAPPPEPSPPKLGLPGRAEEVAGISRCWAAATSGRSAVLLIAGEAGIGKSRLAAEAVRVARATGGTILQAQCHEIERSLFLQPFVDALAPRVTRLAWPVLREMVGDRAGVLARLIPGTAPTPQPVEEAGRRCAFEAVAGFLRALSGRKPVLLVLEDLHLAGTATVELVHYLARRASGARLLVVATARTSEGAAAMDLLGGAVLRLDLGPLPAQAVEELAENAGQGGQAHDVFHRTRGHPLFVVEVLRGLAAGESGLPEALREAVLERVRRMGGTAERLLRAASVLEGPFDPAALGELLGVSPQVAAEQCERALGNGLIVVAGSRYEFANELTREALYSSTPAPTRGVYRHMRNRPELALRGSPGTSR